MSVHSQELTPVMEFHLFCLGPPSCLSVRSVWFVVCFVGLLCCLLCRSVLRLFLVPCCFVGWFGWLLLVVCFFARVAALLSFGLFWLCVVGLLGCPFCGSGWLLVWSVRLFLRSVGLFVCSCPGLLGRLFLGSVQSVSCVFSCG